MNNKNMVNFVLLEKDEFESKKIKNIIMNYMMKNKFEFDILEYFDVNSELLNLIDKNESNYIYLLNFEVKNFNALEIARKIRQNDWVSPIIVLGGVNSNIFKQRLQILDFLDKEDKLEKNLHELFDICFKQLRVRKNFKYRIGKIDYCIDYHKILYIYKDTVERKSVVVTENSEYKIPLNLVKVKELLTDDFIFTHKA